MIEDRPSVADQLLLFARNFLKHPLMLGSVIPSSRFLIREMLKPVDWNRAKVFVEYGPGVGNITAEILARMPADGRLIAFELNPDFVEFLPKVLPDPRLIVLHRSAADVGVALRELGLDGADYIISGIPFSTMPEDVRVAILNATNAALRPGGKFLVYQFSPKVFPYLKRFFGRVDRGFEPLNVPPAQLFFCSPQVGMAE